MIKKIRSHYLALNGKSRRGLWITLILMFSLLGFGGFTIPELTSANNLYEFLANGIPIFLGLLSGLSAILIWLGRPRTGSWILIVSLLAGMIAVPVLAEGFGFVAAVFAFAGVSFITGQTLSKSERSWVNIIAVIVAVSIIAIEIYFPGDRIEPDSQDIRVALMIASIVLIIYGIVIIRQFKNYSMRTKLVILFVVTTIIVAGGISAYTIYATRQFHTNSVGGTLIKFARTQGLSVGDILFQEIENLSTLSLDSNLYSIILDSEDGYPDSTSVDLDTHIKSEIKSIDSEWRVAYEDNNSQSPLVASRLSWSILARSLKNYGVNFPDHLDLMVTDKYGALIASTYFPPIYDHGQEVWWKAAYSDGLGSIFISQPFYDEDNEQNVIGIAIPVKKIGSSEIIGVIYSKYQIAALENVLFGEYLKGAAFAELIIPGDIPNMVREGELVPVEPEIIGRLNLLGRQKSKEYDEIVFNQIPSFAAIAPVDSSTDKSDVIHAIRELNWSIMVHEPTELVTSQIDQQVDTTLIITLVFAGLVSILSVLLAQYLTGPLSRLAVVTEQFGVGNYDIRAQVEMSDEIGELSESFNIMASELQGTLEGLEQQILSRTRAIETSAEVSHRLVTILDPLELVSEVVTRLQDGFGFYQVNIYLLDEGEKSLILVGGTGSAGRKLVEQEYRISEGKGHIWRAFEQRDAVIVNDAHSAPGWLPNPLIPETKSEMVIPIILGDSALGVLDIQQDFINGFSDQDVKIVSSISNQVAVALRNASQYSQELAKAGQEASIHTILRKIQSTRSMPMALQVSIRELGQILRIRRTAAWVDDGIIKR